MLFTSQLSRLKGRGARRELRAPLELRVLARLPWSSPRCPSCNRPASPPPSPSFPNSLRRRNAREAIGRGASLYKPCKLAGQARAAGLGVAGYLRGLQRQWRFGAASAGGKGPEEGRGAGKSERARARVWDCFWETRGRFSGAARLGSAAASGA